MTSHEITGDTRILDVRDSKMFNQENDPNKLKEPPSLEQLLPVQEGGEAKDNQEGARKRS